MGNTVLGSCVCKEPLSNSFHARYDLGKRLGKGSQGSVHTCTDKRTGVKRAVKIIDSSGKNSWAAFKREVDLCKAAPSKNLIRVLEEFVELGSCYVVMEKFAGHLRKGLKWVTKESEDRGEEGLNDAVLRRIVRQAHGAILHLHNCCIVHRDVKAHNLFIDQLDIRDESCRVVLGDLGLASRLEHGSFLSALVGTRKYWAPELYDKKYWHVVDVFALGVLVFLAASNSYPYADEEQTRVRDVVADGAVPASLCPDARDFMLRLLEKDPSKRPSAAQLTGHSWLAAEYLRVQPEDGEEVVGGREKRLPPARGGGKPVPAVALEVALLPINGALRPVRLSPRRPRSANVSDAAEEEASGAASLKGDGGGPATPSTVAAPSAGDNASSISAALSLEERRRCCLSFRAGAVRR